MLFLLMQTLDIPAVMCFPLWGGKPMQDCWVNVVLQGLYNPIQILYVDILLH